MGENKGKTTRRVGIVRGPYRSKRSKASAQPVARRCLACGKTFKSDLPARVNRICPKCTYLEGRDNGMFGSSTPIVDHGGWSSRDGDD